MITVALIVYFFIMYAVGLVHTIELRFFNLAIMLFGIYKALQQYKRTHDGHLNYFRGLAIGVSTATIGASTFAVFLMIYLKIDQQLMNYIINNDPMGQYLNEYIAAAVVTAEGVFSGLAITYILLNWMETDHVANPT